MALKNYWRAYDTTNKKYLSYNSSYDYNWNENCRYATLFENKQSLFRALDDAYESIDESNWYKATIIIQEVVAED